MNYWNISSKIEHIIRTVLAKLCPHIDKSSKKSCTNYIHMAEMPSVSDVHKAASLAGSTQGHMNSDKNFKHEKNSWFIY